ncbi:MAG: hypothetical protein ACE149_08365 [Armatimonadota bacterium]
MSQREADNEPTRLVLPDVPRVGFYPKQSTSSPEDDPFPACLRSYLQYTGDAFDHDRLAATPGDAWHHVHCYLMGISGAAFRLLWNPTRWDDGACADIANTAADPTEPFGRAFAAIGYGYELLLRSEHARRLGYTGVTNDDEARYRERIVESLRAGKPVIAFGVIGPPEACLVTGYDEGGDVLIGWNFFQDDPVENPGGETEPSGYFRKRHWFAGTRGIIVIGGREPRPPQPEIHRSALAWGLSIMRTPEVRGRTSGHAAYTAWAEALLRDDQFATDDAAVLMQRYFMHYATVGTVAEARYWGNVFLAQIAAEEPRAAQELREAAACFVAEHDLMWAVWEFAGGNAVSDAHARKFADPTVRRRIVPLIRLAQEKDEQAGDLIERATSRLGGPR